MQPAAHLVLSFLLIGPAASFLVAVMVHSLPTGRFQIFSQDNVRTAVLAGDHCTGLWCLTVAAVSVAHLVVRRLELSVLAKAEGMEMNEGIGNHLHLLHSTNNFACLGCYKLLHEIRGARDTYACDLLRSMQLLKEHQLCVLVFAFFICMLHPGIIGMEKNPSFWIFGWSDLNRCKFRSEPF